MRRYGETRDDHVPHDTVDKVYPTLVIDFDGTATLDKQATPTDTPTQHDRWRA